MFHFDTSGLFHTIWADPDGEFPSLRTREEIARIIITWRMKLLPSPEGVVLLRSTRLDEMESFLYVGSEYIDKIIPWSEV